MPEGSRINDLVGPFYRVDDVAAMLDREPAALGGLLADGLLLGARTSDGEWVFPVFQFTDTGEVRPDLVPVLSRLTRLSGWTAAVWLRTRNDDLDDSTPEAWLAAGRNPDIVQVIASHHPALAP